MGTRTITECDRHKREIPSGSTLHTVVMPNGERKEICDMCKRDLDKFMSGEKLEVPP